MNSINNELVIKGKSTPHRDGLVMPGEFEPHARCWMAWPCNEAVFPGRLREARRAYTQVARAIAGFEPLTLIARPEDAEEAAALCGPAVTVVPRMIDDSWTRDTGPTFITDRRGGVAGVDWIFNGWGGVWPDFEHDAHLARSVLADLGMRRYETDFVLEGGAIHTDGQGTLMAVAPCLLDPGRNPGMTLAEMERRLTDHLGVTSFLWLEHGLENDETAGHVDNVACFARPGVVLIQTTDDPSDGDYHGSMENLSVLKKARDAQGRALEVIEVPAPSRREGKDGRMALSYINFYPANGGLVMPSFGDPADRAAHGLLTRVFPDRRIVQVPALDILHGGGGIHCITLQQPTGVPLPPF